MDNFSRLLLPGATDRTNQLKFLSLAGGDFNTFAGYNSGNKYPGTLNTFVGAQTGSSAKSSQRVVLVGAGAGEFADRITDSVFQGCKAGARATDVTSSVFIGTQAGEIATRSTLNVAIGHKSLSALQLGSENCTLGAMSGAWASAVSGSVFVGYSAGANASGDRNTLVGAYAGSALGGGGDDNTVLGILALGNSASVAISNNTIAGSRCAANLRGNLNVVMGSDTAPDTIGDRNTYLGARITPTVQGSDNVVIGTDNMRKPDLRFSNCVVVGQRIEPSTATFMSNSIYIGKDLQISDEEARNTLVIGVGSSKYIVANETTMTVLTGSFNATSTGAAVLNVQDALTLGVDNTFLQSETRLYVSATKGKDTNRGTSLDRPLKTLRRACALAREYTTTIFVEGGVYLEENPIYVKPGTSIIGDSLRRCLLYAVTPTLDYFHTAEATYFTGLRFLNLKKPASCVAFPCALAEVGISGSSVANVTVLYQPPNGYVQATPPSILIDPPLSTTGTFGNATLQFNTVNGLYKIAGATVTSGGTGYSSSGLPVHVSIPARPHIRATVTCTINAATGGVTGVVFRGYDTSNVEVPLTGYTTEYMPLVTVAKPGTLTGLQASVRVTSLYANGGIQSWIIDDPGTTYTTAPTATIDSPPFQQPIIRASPYVLNCTALSGPFHKTLGNIVLRTPPYSTTDIDVYGAGGGLRVDGAVVSPSSTLRSMVSSAFTQVCQGGCGFHAVNAGYMQLVSCITTFASTGILATSGGFINVSNSVTDFGDIGLKAAGYFRVPYATGTFVDSSTSSVASISVTNGGAGYTGPTAAVSFSGGGGAAGIAAVDTSVASIVVTNGGSGYVTRPTVTISSPTGRGALATAELNGSGVVTRILVTQGGTDYYKANTTVSITGTATAVALIGKVTRVDITNGGSGYVTVPTVTIAQPEDPLTPKQPATATAAMTGASTYRLKNFPVLRPRPDIGSIANVYGTWCTVTNVTDTLVTGQLDVTFSPAPIYTVANDVINFHLVSYITSGSHICEYTGTGVTYNALPEYGGIPDTSKQVESISPGRVYYVTTDNNGNTKFGPFFSIDQSTGTVSLTSENFNISGLSALGPFRYNGVAVGSRLQEVTNSATLDSASVPSETVPTVTAIKSYLQTRTVPSGGTVGQVLTKLSGSAGDVGWSFQNLANTTGILAVAQGGTGVTTSTGSGNTVLSDGPTLTNVVAISGNGFGLSSLHLANTSGILAVARGGTGVTTSTGSGNTVLSDGPTFSSNLIVRGASPTVFLRDTDHVSAMVQCDTGKLTFQRGGVDSLVPTQVNGQWPFLCDLTTNDCTVGGNLFVINAVAANASDERLKSNVRLLEHALDKVTKLRGVSFDWNSEGPQPMRGHDVGLIAQDVAGVLQEAVTVAPFDRDEAGASISGEQYLAVDCMNNKLMALVVEAIKELAAKVRVMEESRVSRS